MKMLLPIVVYTICKIITHLCTYVIRFSGLLLTSISQISSNEVFREELEKETSYYTMNMGNVNCGKNNTIEQYCPFCLYSILIQYLDIKILIESTVHTALFNLLSKLSV